MDGARAIALRESSLLVYAIARWIVRESPYKYLKDKTTCLDVFGKLLSSAGFSKGFVRLLVVCSGDCLRAASNRQSVARLNLEYLYDIVRESTSPSLDVSDIIALTLRADCDVSGLQEGSCWQNYFLENAPSESQAMVVSSDSHFGQAKLGNMKALSAFADDALDRARKRVDHVPEGELEAALDELDRAVWLQMLVKESLDLSGETDDTTFLAMLTCAVWVDSENVRASFRCGKRELLSPNVVNRLIRTLSRHSIKTDAYHFASLALWYYSGLQGGRFISRNDLREIVLSACDILVKSRSQTEKASAMRVLSTVPLDVFSQFVPSKDALERPTIDVLRHHLETDSSCLLCCLLVLSRIGSRPCGTARFVEMVLQNLSAEGHFNNMIVDSLMFEMQLQAKYDATLSSYLEGSLELSGHNDVAYIIDHGFAVGHYSLELDSEKILIDLIDKKPSLFPIVNLFLHYLQNEGDTDKAFAFYRRTIEAINPTNGDLNSASAWWGKMAGIEQPEGLLVSLLLEASGWKIRRCHIGDRRTRGERISVNAFRKFVKTELKKNKGHSFEKASIEEAIQRYYGDAVLDGIRALALRT